MSTFLKLNSALAGSLRSDDVVASSKIPVMTYDEEPELFLINGRSTLQSKKSVYLTMSFICRSVNFVQTFPFLDENITEMLNGIFPKKSELQSLLYRSPDVDVQSKNNINLHLLVTLKVPIESTSPTHDEWSETKLLKSKLTETLNTALLQPVALSENSWLRVMSSLSDLGVKK